MNKGYSIAIDGPVAAGKGTIATALAKKLKGSAIDTGVTYRCIALLCIQNKLDVNIEKNVVNILHKANIVIDNRKVFLNGRNVTQRIRKEDVSNGSSIVGVYPEVRNELVKKQQLLAKNSIGKGKIVIMEGRDIGTRVLPNAELKIFLTANVQVRVKRGLERYKQKGIIKTLSEVLHEVKERDYRDSHRKVDPLPLKPDKYGYWTLDNSSQTVDETVAAVIKKLKERELVR